MSAAVNRFKVSTVGELRAALDGLTGDTPVEFWMYEDMPDDDGAYLGDRIQSEAIRVEIPATGAVRIFEY